MSSLFVGSLSSHVRHRELETVFRRFGRCNLELKDGFGFVIYEDHGDARRALEALHGRSICGEQPLISWARKKRPFQRFPGKGNFMDKYRYNSRRRTSLEIDKSSDDVMRDEKFVDEGKDDLGTIDRRDDSIRTAEREVGWKDPGPDKLICDDDGKDADPSDCGRWDPRMEGSPDNLLVQGLLEGVHSSYDKNNEDKRISLQEKSQESPREMHHEWSTRIHRNLSDQHRRGRDTFGGRKQERCYNCGQSGHVKWQCRSRGRRMNILNREGGHDGRRNDLRYPSNRGAFRGMGGGRFRGSNGARRLMARDIEPGFVKRSLRRHEPKNSRKHLAPPEGKNHERSRRRRQRSESPKDSSSRGRSRQKQKKSGKKSIDSSKKRHRSSSSSFSSSHSQRSTSSSPSRSSSHSESRSGSSKSGSQSPYSGSRSASSRSQSSRSRSSPSSSSRSCSLSSQSRKSASKSKSVSQYTRSQSPESNRTSHQSSSHSHSRHVVDDDKEVVTSQTPELQNAYKMPIDAGKDNGEDSKCLSESQGMNRHDAKGSERGSLRDTKKQKLSRVNNEEEVQKVGPQSNGLNDASKFTRTDNSQLHMQLGGVMSESCSKDSVHLKGSGKLEGQILNVECNMYAAILKGNKEDGIANDLGNVNFGAARLWPWEAMLYRRLQRGPISTANYERRKAQNEEFGIKDKYVRSSSGWWENSAE
ncbi:hypothetical protein KP509_07G047500 [Ceratopteris richardii]|nr:hypothetical protein KP509_07G047500 [Ceratopteris richardii]KAH7432946.1 hypothetical protein KP509_07G047500 [Ceratopteris richardii]KAH7432947.1 hypothetical protein KP509_07G047500 [Ceratopteris richardii]KAH7432948.1 hypothetical protein KP509_07G047500 [Ceratopteris richardii]KAH7432949.1 hypothetical protein KP509_07G047500 [Ceratopteris richardii]